MSKNEQQKQEAQPLEISDDELIEVYTNYERGGLVIENEDRDKRYFFAANDDDKIRPDGVTRVQQLGYKVSDKRHNSPDCTLMEMSRDRWDRMQKLRHKSRIQSRKERTRGLERDIGENLVRLDK